MTNYQLSDGVEYQARRNLNLYECPKCDRLATQATTGRHLRFDPLPIEEDAIPTTAVRVRLCEDDYPGWLTVSSLVDLEIAQMPYQAPILSETEIRSRLPSVIAFAYQAMNQPNEYLWGGTVGPNYDCSGLMQAAFASVGIQLPRDAYQQEAFLQPISLEVLAAGDLIFFGSPAKATHVGLYLGDQRYLHSSGKEIGRNGIGIDTLSEEGDAVSQAYYQQLRGAGRVVASYQPRG